MRRQFNSSVALLLVLVAPVAATLGGCSGLKLWQKGRYFQTRSAVDYQPEAGQRVAVYVFSDGEPIDGTESRSDAFDVISSILTLPAKILSGGMATSGVQIGLSANFYPDPIEPTAVFEPDTSNAGPSLELARALREQLNERGYSATVMSGLGHSGSIPLSSVLAHARSEGYDRAFVVYYSGLKTWTKYAGTETHSYGRTTVIQTNVAKYEGYLFLPNAALLSTADGRELWSFSYYGVVQRAHLPNLSNEPFIEVASENAIVTGADDYTEAAKNAAKQFFEPGSWTTGFVTLPAAGDRKTRM